MDKETLLENLILVEGELVDFDCLFEAARNKKSPIDFNSQLVSKEKGDDKKISDARKLHKKFYSALHSNVLDVWFIKQANMRSRKIRCTLNPDLIPDDQKGKGIVDRSKEYEYMNVYDLKKKDWRGFRLDNVYQVRAVNQVEFPQHNQKLFSETFELVDFYGNKI